MKCLKALFATLVLSLCVSAFAAQPVDINVANAETLAQAIKGVGLKKAEAIVAYREKNGAFSSVDDLQLVDGIGEKTVNESRDLLTTGAGSN